MRLARLGVVTLDHPHPAQRLGQPTRDLGVDLGPLAKNGPYDLESILQNENKRAHHNKDRQRNRNAAMQQKEERQHGGQQAAHKLHQPGAHQVAHAFHVGHDARHQRAGAILVVVGH